MRGGVRFRWAPDLSGHEVSLTTTFWLSDVFTVVISFLHAQPTVIRRPTQFPTISQADGGIMPAHDVAAQLAASCGTVGLF